MCLPRAGSRESRRRAGITAIAGTAGTTRTGIGVTVADPMPTSIDRAQAQRLISEGAQLVEVLPAKEYGEGHIPGAINLPLKELDAETARVLDPNRPVVVYCWDSL